MKFHIRSPVEVSLYLSVVLKQLLSFVWQTFISDCLIFPMSSLCMPFHKYFSQLRSHSTGYKLKCLLATIVWLNIRKNGSVF